MFDADLAEMYGVPTKVLVQTLKRNLARFPDDFAFYLSFEELRILKSQFVTSRLQVAGMKGKNTGDELRYQGIDDSAGTA